MRDAVSRIVTERERVGAALKALDLFFAPSEANFFFFRTPLESKNLFDALLKEGIIIKPWLEPGYEHFVRASIGTPSENDRLIAALKKILDP
jgi:histidinol-phosphate aminotransferase